MARGQVTTLVGETIISTEEAMIESFAQYIEFYWQSRKRFQYSYDTKLLEIEEYNNL